MSVYVCGRAASDAAVGEHSEIYGHVCPWLPNPLGDALATTNSLPLLLLGSHHPENSAIN